jgi:hypothetical protein
MHIESGASLFGHFQVVNGFTANNRLITPSIDPVNNALNARLLISSSVVKLIGIIHSILRLPVVGFLFCGSDRFEVEC